MPAPRALYVTFSILYFITLAIVLWFLLYYSVVPTWVWIFFGVAILISIICLIIREFAIKKEVTASGKVKSNGFGAWSILYILLQISALILVIVGLIFVIIYSNIPWWIWVILGAAIILIFLAAIMSIIPVAGPIIALIMIIIGLIAYVVGLILLVIYSNAPWWIWILIGVMILFGILASIFEAMSERPKVVVPEEHETTRESCTITVKPVSTESKTIDFDLLPGADIPEQVIYS